MILTVLHISRLSSGGVVDVHLRSACNKTGMSAYAPRDTPIRQYLWLDKALLGSTLFFIKVVVIGHFIESEHAKNTRTQTKRIHRNIPSKADRCSVSYTPRSVGEQTKKKRKIVTHGLKVPCGRSSPKSPVYFSSQRTASQSAPEHHCVLQVTLS